ncbi:protein TIFY 5A-like [Vicia villosa]|uniref:protein TIFY 5A-like n=1 Tax=Vicia villosa TaxID=3911 RepID=UPI00273B991D|nr:protein TIFY 5A-like [Vicia villosa]
MRRNCNLELCLFPQYVSDSTHNQNNHMFEEEKDSDKSSMQNQQQPLTIFYDGKMCVIDVTEFQAKSILMMADRKVQETVMTPESKASTPTIVQSPHQLYSPGPAPALSMRTSLQRFLQKRKNRIQQASPYNH